MELKTGQRVLFMIYNSKFVCLVYSGLRLLGRLELPREDVTTPVDELKAWLRQEANKHGLRVEERNGLASSFDIV